MSAFDLAPDRAFENQINHARENALDLSRPAGFFTGLPTAAETGVGRLVADAQRVTGLALGAAAGSFDLLTGDAIKAQDNDSSTGGGNIGWIKAWSLVHGFATLATSGLLKGADSGQPQPDLQQLLRQLFD